MRVRYPGHVYELDHLDGHGTQTLQFVQRKPHHEPREGTTSQEVLRALIDRTKLLDSEVSWEGNAKIVHHLRMAIALFEARAILRKTEKGELLIEHMALGDDGHLRLLED